MVKSHDQSTGRLVILVVWFLKYYYNSGHIKTGRTGHDSTGRQTYKSQMKKLPQI
jgi:hypothetical protein